MDTKKFFKNLGNIITDILVVASLLLLVFSVYTAYSFKENPENAYLMGYKPVFILTGSMEPTLRTNGVAIVHKATYDEVEVGDIIMYEIEDKMITHRIVEKSEEGIITKGDNNNSRDSYLLTDENVKAKVVSIWNWTAKPVGQIWPNGFGNEVSKKALAKWIGFPIFVIIVIKILFYVIKKINSIDDEKLEKKGKKEIPENSKERG